MSFINLNTTQPKKMSHFTTIKTQISQKEVLVEALQLLGYYAEENQELKVTGAHGVNHEVVNADLAISKDIGFRLNETTGTYELVTDLETWSENVPVKRFIDKVNQQYSRMLVHSTVKEEGFQVQEEWEMDDGSIELTVTRWTS
tara:strand:- start:232 stop:663 length:432 start_codon:yes stop_codon:yes gene_type:complete